MANPKDPTTTTPEQQKVIDDQIAAENAKADAEKSQLITKLQAELAGAKNDVESLKANVKALEQELAAVKADRDKLKGTMDKSKIATLDLGKGEGQVLEPTPAMTGLGANKTRVSLKVGDGLVSKPDDVEAMQKKLGAKGRVYVLPAADIKSLAEQGFVAIG